MTMRSIREQMRVEADTFGPPFVHPDTPHPSHLAGIEASIAEMKAAAQARETTIALADWHKAHPAREEEIAA